MRSFYQLISVKMLPEEIKVLGMHSLFLSNVEQPRERGFLFAAKEIQITEVQATLFSDEYFTSKIQLLKIAYKYKFISLFHSRSYNALSAYFRSHNCITPAYGV